MLSVNIPASKLKSKAKNITQQNVTFFFFILLHPCSKPMGLKIYVLQIKLDFREDNISESD